MGSQLQGPPVSIQGLAAPKLRVRGLPQGSILNVKITPSPAEGALFITADGNYELTEATWLQIGCDKVCRTLICDVVSNKAA